MTIAIIALGVLCVLLAVYIVLRLPRQKTGGNEALLLKADMSELNKSLLSLKDGLQQQLSEQLGANNKQMAAQFNASAKIIQEVTRKLTELDRTNKNVGDIASELKTLQNVLQNPKQRGVIGEYYLEQILKNTLPPG
ncbi:MAG: DNA recombination protein RmuC, partial [Candidatus Saccharimonadales bacterium]